MVSFNSYTNWLLGNCLFKCLLIILVNIYKSTECSHMFFCF